MLDEIEAIGFEKGVEQGIEQGIEPVSYTHLSSAKDIRQMVPM